jgi:predicted house-cleaning NTP pyrophosphatase (Maf/HAM1 superfamily)
MTIQFDVDLEHYSYSPDDLSIGTNRARAQAAITKVDAAKVVIESDRTSAQDDYDLLDTNPTTANAIAVLKDTVLRQRRILARQAWLADVIVAIVRAIIKLARES